MIKICKECGKEFEASNGMQKFCKRKHYRRCVICGNQFEVTPYHLTSKDAKTTCSRKCAAELRKQTNIAKYGGVAPACSKDVISKMESTNMARYGVKHASQSDVFKDKSVRTNLERYGVSHYSKTEESKKKLSERCLDDDYKEIVKDSKIKTSLERYGVPYPMQSSIVSNEFIRSHMKDNSKFDEFISFKQNPRDYISSLHLDHNPTLLELTKILGVNESTLGVYIHQNNCEDMINFHVSVMEQEVIDFIKSIGNDTIIETNTYKIIPPYEIDIYLPKYGISIECNPTATHNSTINVFDRSSGPAVSSGYHKMKTDMCENAGVRLFHIFGSEWTYKRPIIESMILNMLGRSCNKIYARNCIIREVSYHDSAIFLDDNHRQGDAKSSIRLGLYYYGELVSIMTFGKMRSTIGTGKENLSDCWELVRFCSKLNTTVIGGASKLFKFFINNYNVDHIRSFSDRAHTTGKLYGTLGFVELRRSNAGYCWVDVKSDISYNRTNSQKHNLKRFLNDNTIDLTKTEKQIMEDHGYVQVFDSGTITWEWYR